MSRPNKHCTVFRLTDLGGFEKCTIDDLGIDLEKLKKEYQQDESPPDTPGVNGHGEINVAFNDQSDPAVPHPKKPVDLFEVLQMVYWAERDKPERDADLDLSLQKQKRMAGIAGDPIWKIK